MKKLFTLITIISLFSCGSSKKEKKEVPKAGIMRIAAVIINRDGSRVLDAPYREILKIAKFDSIKKIDYVDIDTIYAKKLFYPKMSAANQPILINGQAVADTSKWTFVGIHKDSCIWDLVGKDIDSLLNPTKVTSITF